MDNSDFDKHLERLIAREKETAPNPFAATRIMQRLDNEYFNQPQHFAPTWTRILQPVAIVFALAVGILIGSYTARSGQDSVDQAQTKTQQIETLKTELFISELTNENNLHHFNK